MPARRKYSSVEGCCICGVNKSEKPFQNASDISHKKTVISEVFRYCFKLDEERSGDLCTACLNLAKRWLRTNRVTRKKQDWSKVVDSKRKANSRSSGEKTASGSTSSNSDTNSNPEEIIVSQEGDTSHDGEKDLSNENEHTEGEQKGIIPEDALSDDDNDSDNLDDAEIIDGTELDFDVASLKGNDNNNCIESSKKETISIGTQTAFLFPALTSPQANANKLPFIDLSKWRQEDICCGTIFRGPNGEVLVDPKWLRSSCEMCNRSSQPPTPVNKNDSEAITVFDAKLADLCA